MRALLLTLVLTSTFFASTALADVAPEPERPEFEHTPLPMPDVPTGIAMLILAMAIVGGLWWLRRRQQET